MSDADKPWSAPPAGSSSGSDTASLSPSKTAPIENARITGHEDLRASLVQAADEFRRKQGERQAESGQSTGQAVLPSVANVSQSASLQDSGPTAPDMSDMTQALNECFAARDEEKAWLARLDTDKGANTAAEARSMNSSRSAGSGPDLFLVGAREQFSDEQRGWAVYSNTEAAGERQHDSEERRRSNGISL